MSDLLNKLPSTHKKDVQTAIKILKKSGCTEIFLFGSIAHGNAREDSDLDIAVKGCPSGLFFRLIGTLLLTLEHSVDLVNLDKQISFSKFLQDNKELVRVA